MAHRFDKFAEKLFGNSIVYFDGNTVYLHLNSRDIQAN